jgi:site-specific recombinase XerD
MINNGLSIDNALFSGRQNAQRIAITRQRAHQIYVQIFEMAHVVGGKLGTHACRKSFAAFIYGKSKDILLVKTLLRHSSINSTFSYLESALESVKTAVMQLSFN